MDRFVRLERERLPSEPTAENVMRITNTGRMRSYISYATNLLELKGLPTVVLEGMGRAINKTVTVVEILKRRVRGLHQITEISSVDIIDCWEPLEEGLHRLETKRSVSMVTITLSKTPLDTSSPGYQEPLPDDQVLLALLFPCARSLCILSYLRRPHGVCELLSGRWGYLVAALCSWVWWGWLRLASVDAVGMG